MIYDRITMKDVIMGLLNQGGVSVGLLIIKINSDKLITRRPSPPLNKSWGEDAMSSLPWG